MSELKKIIRASSNSNHRPFLKRVLTILDKYADDSDIKQLGYIIDDAVFEAEGKRINHPIERSRYANTDT